NFFNPQSNDTTILPPGNDSVFPISNMEALLRYGDTGSPALTSDLFRLLPINLGDPSMQSDPVLAAKIRNLVTTHSFGYDRPGVTPWVWNPPENTQGVAQPYQMANDPTNAGTGYPNQAGGVATAIKFPDLTPAGGSTRFRGNEPAGSEF